MLYGLCDAIGKTMRRKKKTTKTRKEGELTTGQIEDEAELEEIKEFLQSRGFLGANEEIYGIDF